MIKAWFRTFTCMNKNVSLISHVHEFEENVVRGFMIKAWCQILQVYIKSWPRFHV